MMKKLVYFNNSLNHHQVLVADELFKMLGDDFIYVAISPVGTVNLKGGKDYSNRTYCLKASESKENQSFALELSRSSAVCVFGAESMPYAKERARHNPKGLSFEVGERWLKKGWINLFSPNLIKWWWTYKTIYSKANFFKLCASAYAVTDHEKLHTYINRCFKWGYFTRVDNSVDEVERKEVDSNTVTMLWCARFLDWKHPELVIILARKLKENGRQVVIDMYGEGIEFVRAKELCHKLGVQDVVNFKGAVPNEDVLSAMRKHDVFLFTSDKNEGWGVVLNEALSNGCAVVASNEIGSVPYLVKDGDNGMIFKSGDAESLYEKVIYLLDHPDRKKSMAKKGCQLMMNVWSPQNAAKSLLQLINDLQNNRPSSIIDGPASIA